jgi:glycosyltransferase involved in cell wall biosynthesis
MKILYLSCDTGVPIRGNKGASVHVRGISGALRRLGHEVRGFSPALDGLEYDEETGFWGIPVAGFVAEILDLARGDLAEADGVLRDWRRILYNEYIQKTLLPRLEAWRPDVIYERYTLFGYQGVELARYLGIPLLMELNSPLWLEAATYRGLVLKRTAEELERRVLNSAAAVFVVSNALSNYTREIGVPAARTMVLANGIDPTFFNPSISGAAARGRYSLDGKWVVGFVGGLRPWQDIATVVEAVGRLHLADNRVHLLVVGDGPAMADLQSLQADFITLAGSVEHRAVPELTAAMDVVVVPYHRGGEPYFSPLKLFEAMAMAKPIVGANIGQVKEVIVHGSNGLLYEPSDPEDLAEKLSHILKMPDKGTALAVSACELVNTRYTWEGNARRIVSVAESLLSGK